ncbi:MAG: hypothetical protein ACRDB0_00695 [Paraclostridium sp.]
MNNKKYLVVLSSILLLQSLSITSISAQKLIMPEHPSVYKHQVNQKQVNNNNEIKNINQNRLLK